MEKIFEELDIEAKIELIDELKDFVDQLKHFADNPYFVKLLENQGLEIVVPDLEKMVHDVLNG